MTTKTDGQPFMAVGNDELGGELGDAVRCPKCGESHPLEYGTSRTYRPDGTMSDPVICKSMAFYRCDDKMYMAGVGGKYLTGLEGA